MRGQRRTLKRELRTCSGDGEVLAGERGGVEGAGGDVRGGDVVDVADVEVGVAEVGVVHLGLVGVDVVGPEDAPALVLEGEADEADAGEEFGGGEGQ